MANLELMQLKNILMIKNVKHEIDVAVLKAFSTYHYHNKTRQPTYKLYIHNISSSNMVIHFFFK